MTTAIYEHPVETLDGKKKDLREYEGKVLLIVNTASKCGFTPQYAGLEELYKKYKDQGFAVLGFPCNQFGAQEPGDENAIGAFCERNYGVSFPMHAKVDVNGRKTHPLFQQLKREAKGAFGTELIKWNFTKFLVDRRGRVVARYGSRTRPEEITGKIESLLREP